MINLTSTVEHFQTELMSNAPSPALLVRAGRLGRLSASGRVFEIGPDRASQVLRRLILKASEAFPVTPGVSPKDVLSFVHGGQAVAATLCYGVTRRARYLIREEGEGKVIFRNLKGTEHTLDREEALALFRGYGMTAVFLMPVPTELGQPVPAKTIARTEKAPVTAAPAASVPLFPAPPRPAFQSRRPSYSGIRAVGKSG